MDFPEDKELAHYIIGDLTCDISVRGYVNCDEGMVKRVKITKKDEILEVIELRNALNQRALDL